MNIFSKPTPKTASDLGLTLRDLFAAHALSGMLANPAIRPEIILSHQAYILADQMLATRGRPQIP